MLTNIHTALLRHNQQLPRYTSYPTVPHFGDNIDSESVLTWMSDIPVDAPLSLYFHIPFCKKLCWYCGCNTKATQRYERLENYLTHLKNEVSLVANRLGEKRQVSHIHFGGGSPSFLHPDDFEDLMHHVHNHFTILPIAEIAIELDPRETSEAKIAMYAQCGVTRASLGVQDFNSKVQQAINRVQPFHQVFKNVGLLRQYGINEISFDLLYGLPHQTTKTIHETITLAAALRPDRIALFGYAHVPWMKKHMRLIDETKLPGALERLEQFDEARKELQSHGYQDIGLDHFVKPTDSLAYAHKTKCLRRNFQGYTNDSTAHLIGFGPSAISAFDGGYCQNIPDERAYSDAISKQRLPVVKGIKLSKNDKMRRNIIEKIMCYGKISLNTIVAEYQLEPHYFEPEIEALTALALDGLVSVEDGLITINPDAPQASRLIAAVFDTYLQPVPQKHAQVA